MASGQRADGNTRSMDDDDRIPVASAGNTKAQCEVTNEANHCCLPPLQCAQCARCESPAGACCLADFLLSGWYTCTPPLLPGAAMVGSRFISLDIPYTPTFRKAVLLATECRSFFATSDKCP